MTADVALLPCPFCGDGEHLLVEHLEGTILHPAHQIRCDNCGACSGYTDRDFRANWNTRANVEHHTAAKDAEIEALRAEVERWKVPLLEWLDKTEWVQQTLKPVELGHHRADITRLRLEQAEARAERLAEALREAEEYIDDVTPTWASKGQRVLDTIRTALHPAAAQDGGNACHHINTVRGEDGVRWCQHCRQQIAQENDDA